MPETALRLTSTMWALLNCIGCLSPDDPLSEDWLREMLEPDYRHKLEATISGLIKAGLLERVSGRLVRLSAKGRQHIVEHPASLGFQQSVEVLLLQLSSPLVDQVNVKALRLLQPHLWSVTYRAMPRADDTSVVLAMTLFLCLAHTHDWDRARRFAQDVKSLEQAIGHDIVPANTREAIAQAGQNEMTMTLAMKYILQSVLFLAKNGPVPIQILHGIFEPRSDARQAVQDLLSQGFLQQADPGTVRPAERSVNLVEPPDPELKEGILAGVLDANSRAVKAHDRDMLRHLQPHLRPWADQAISQGDETAYRLASAIVECLVELGEFDDIYEYMDAVEELGAKSSEAAAIGEGEERDPARVLNYHGQAGVHYYLKEDYSRALKHFERAIRATSDPAMLAQLYKKVGECCHRLLDASGEIYAYGKALDKAIEHYGRDHWEIIPHRTDLALVLVRYDQLDAAAKQMDEALALSEAAQIEEIRFLVETAKATLVLADVYYCQGEKHTARQLVERCIKMTQRAEDSWGDQIMLFYAAASLMYRNEDLDLAQIPLAGALEICHNLPDGVDKEAQTMCEQTRDLARLLGVENLSDEKPSIVNKKDIHFLRRRREELGLSQRDLALRLLTRGVKLSRTAIGNWERGKHQPELDEKAISAIADVLKWDLDQLKDAISRERD